MTKTIKIHPYQTIFSYYGGKGNMAHLYPEPETDLIIEPFAGAAAYSWRYHDRDVLVNDLDPKTYAIWKFLTSEGALDIIETAVPDTVKVGDRVDVILGEYGVVHPGLLYLCQAEANRGTQGAKGVHNQITKFSVRHFRRLKEKMRYVIPRISHWKISNVSYEDLPNVKATWFVDPPYANAAGDRYRLGSSGIDFQHLGEFCRSRWGQVIVCENEGADWLPFRFLHEQRCVKSRYHLGRSREVIWTNPPPKDPDVSDGHRARRSLLSRDTCGERMPRASVDLCAPTHRP